MIICFANWVENIGKSTITIFLTNYLMKAENNTNTKVYLFDKTKKGFGYDLFLKEKDKLGNEFLVDRIDASNEEFFKNEITLEELKNSDDVFIFDLDSKLNYDDLKIIYNSNYLICPFANSDEIIKSISDFSNFISTHILKGISDCEILFVENFSKNKKISEENLKELKLYGEVLNSKIYFTSSLKISFNPVSQDCYYFKSVFEEIHHLIK